MTNPVSLYDRLYGTPIEVDNDTVTGGLFNRLFGDDTSADTNDTPEVDTSDDTNDTDGGALWQRLHGSDTSTTASASTDDDDDEDIKIPDQPLGGMLAKPRDTTAAADTSGGALWQKLQGVEDYMVQTGDTHGNPTKSNTEVKLDSFEKLDQYIRSEPVLYVESKPNMHCLTAADAVYDWKTGVEFVVTAMTPGFRGNYVGSSQSSYLRRCGFERVCIKFNEGDDYYTTIDL